MQYLKRFREGLTNALQLFELSNYESEKKKLNLAKSKEEYFNQLQNLLRNTSFHKVKIIALEEKEKIDFVANFQ